MTRREELERLAERVEALSGPSERLDECIVVALSGVDPMDFEPTGPAPRYTASLDAALSLIPEGIGWTIGFGEVPGQDEPGLFYFAGVSVGPDLQVTFGHQAPALALCAAALRAQAASHD